MGRAERVAGSAFVAAMVVAVPVILGRGRDQWFFQDEWAFLADRDGGDLDDLLRPHNEHWSTVPVVAYRLLWNVVGLRSYLPYQLMAVAGHLLVAGLLRAVLRREGTGPWLATAAGIALLFYGTGHEVLVWGVLIGFSLAIAGGLGLYLVADHPRPGPARIAAAAACGLIAVMSSGTALVVVGTAAVALGLKRGLRTALLPLAPLAVVYLAWYLVHGRDAGARPRPGVGRLVEFTATGLSHAVTGLASHPAVAVLLVVSVAAGLALRTATIKAEATGAAATFDELRRRVGPALAMAVGAVGFYVVSGVSRATFGGTDFARTSRYAYVAVVLLLPLVGLGLQAVADRWHLMLVPTLVLLMIGVPGGIADMRASGRHTTRQEVILALAHDEVTASVGPSTRPFAGGLGERFLTMGWLHDGAASDRIPRPGAPYDPALATEVATLASFVLGDEVPGTACPPLTAETVVRLAAGAPLTFRGRIEIRLEGPGGVLSKVVEAGSFVPRHIESTGPTVTLHITPPAGASPSLCTGDGAEPGG